MMKKRTRGIIRAVKHTTKPVQFIIRDYLVNYYKNAIPEDFPFEILEQILRYTIFDYISNSDNPSNEVYRYFCGRSFNVCKNEWDIMIDFIYNIRVQKDGRYINGFKKEDFHD